MQSALVIIITKIRSMITADQATIFRVCLDPINMTKAQNVNYNIYNF